MEGEFFRRGSSSEEVVRGNMPVNSNLLKCYYMLDLDAGGGGIYPMGFSGDGGLVHLLLRSLMIC